MHKDYDSTLARMAGNIAGGLAGRPEYHPKDSSADCNAIASDALLIAKILLAKLRKEGQQS